ncbi:MAG: DsbA family protein [Gemmatimonadota bacterium]
MKLRVIAPALGLLTLALVATPAEGQRLVQVGDRVISLDGFGIPKGSDSAPVWIVELADFGCSYCAKFASETMPALDSLFTSKGKLSWRYVPFVLGSFPNARQAAEGAVCAGRQGRFWQMHDKLYEKRKEWMSSSNAVITIARLAREAGVNAAQYGVCVRGRDAAAEVVRNDALAKALMVRGTPTFVINGEVVPGSLPRDVFVKGIEAVYKAATAPTGGR